MVPPACLPIHPRTRGALREQGWSEDVPGLHLLEPIGYVEFLGLISRAAGA